MGTKQRKAREKKHRREQILNAAEHIIFSKGIDNATMDEIAKKAELSKGSLYLYFKNKTDLYLAVSLRGSEILHKRFAGVLTKDLTGREMLKQMGEQYITFVKDNPGYYNAFMYYESQCSVDYLAESEVADKCEEAIQEAFTYTVRALQIGMQDGTVDSIYDPRELAIQIWGSVRGLIQLCHMKESGHRLRVLNDLDMELENMVGHFIQLMLRGLKPESGN